MDPNFFADSDPDFKNKDPDPSVFCFNKLMGSKGCSLIRFWKNLTKKDTLDSVNMIYKYFLLVCEQFFGFFFSSWIRIRIFRIGSGFLADLDRKHWALFISACGALILISGKEKITALLCGTFPLYCTV